MVFSLLDKLKQLDKKNRDGYNGPPTEDQQNSNGGYQTPQDNPNYYRDLGYGEGPGTPVQRQSMAPGRTRGGERGGRNPDSTTPDGGDQPDPNKNPAQTPTPNGPSPAPSGGNPIPTNQAPNPLTGDMSQFLAMLSKQGNLDTASQAWQLQRAVQEYGEGRPIEDYLLSLYGGDVMGVDFNMPQNDASGWINQAMGGNYGSGPTGPGGTGATGGTPGGAPYNGGAGLSSGDYATGGQQSTPTERIGRYTDSGREKITQNQKSVRDQLSDGATLASLGIKPVEGQGKVLDSLYKPNGGFYTAFGMMADPTHDYRVQHGVLQWKPKANQPGRIAASGGGGWSEAPAYQQKSYQRMKAFVDGNPGMGAADFLSDKELGNKISKGLVEQIPGQSKNNPLWVGKVNTSYEGIVYDRNGHEIGIQSQPYQGAGLTPEDYNPDYNGGDHGPLNSDGTYADGTTYGGGTPPPGGITNQGSWTLRGDSFDPNNPQAFALIAPQVQSIAQDLDSQKRDLRNMTIGGGERDAALANATIGAYGQKAQARQGLVQDALGYMTNLSKEKKFDVPVGGYTGGASSGLQSLLSKYNTDSNYNLGMAGINQAANATDQASSDNTWRVIGGLLSSLFF